MDQEPRTTSDSIGEELNRLGRQLVEAGRLAWESEDRRRLQTELSENLRTIGDSLETTLQQARASETTRNLNAQAQKVAARVQDAGVVDEVRDALLSGLAGVNRELSRLIDRLATKGTTGAPTSAEPPAAAMPEPPVVPPTTPTTDVPPARPMGPGDPVI